LIWECSASRACECSDISPNNDVIWDSPVDKKLWYRLVEGYTTRHLTFNGDRLLAFSGIASRFSKLSSWTYVAGLWREDIEYDLCWRVNSKAQQKILQRSDDYIAPSWSWASCSVPVSYQAVQSLQWLNSGNPNGSKITVLSADDRHLRIVASMIEVKAYGSPTENGEIELKLAGLSENYDWVTHLQCLSDCGMEPAELQTLESTSSRTQVSTQSEFDKLTRGNGSVFLMPIVRLASGVFVLIITRFKEDPETYIRVGCTTVDDGIWTQFSSQNTREIVLR
jgi:hypothetical protein